MRRSAGTLLAHLLDQESEALRSGNLSALTPIATEKSKILVNLESERVKPSDIATIRAKAARNEALLAAAIRGVKTARDRIAELDVVKKWSVEDGKQIRKIIVVPGRMINVVVG